MKNIIGRAIAIIPALILQILFFILVNNFLDKYATIIYCTLVILAFLFVLYVMNKRDEATYKVLWIIVITTLPILGTILYLFFGNQKTSRGLKKALSNSKGKINYTFTSDQKALDKIKNEDIRMFESINSYSKLTGFPVMSNESVKYYSLGDEMFPDMIEELKKAEKYIFLEYFIIEKGEFWNTIVEILEEKVKENVDVRVIYDDIGSIATHSFKETKELRKKGIHCIPFNPLFFINGVLNNRDHRKMTIIDGKVVFSGGINIADEYINMFEKYGHWKDIGFKLSGESVKSYTYMFIEFWNAFSKNKINSDILNEEHINNVEDGIVFSYYDSPANKVHISYDLYIDLMSQAKDYIWFYTPYLILGDAFIDTLIRTARRGVDVRIIVPGIPDKKIVYKMTKSFYEVLIENGVKIYEYNPGFVHAKACIVDDKVCTIGTVNLDYRSLFLHFECNSLFYKSTILQNLKNDYLKTQEKCKKIERKDIRKGIIHRILNGILRIFAPLC